METEVLMPVAKSAPKPNTNNYLDLVRAFPLRPIRTRQAHRQALKVLRNLAAKRGTSAADYKAVLTSLVVQYERHAGLQIDTSKLKAADILRHLLAEREMSVNSLAKTVGIPQSALSDMLNGKRDWSKSAIIRLADYFALQPGVFLR
jgi:HTH-type transcriptional regulator / antitoxin HigA